MCRENERMAQSAQAKNRLRLPCVGMGLVGAVLFLGLATVGRAAESLWPSTELRQSMQNLTLEQRSISHGFGTSHHAGWGSLQISTDEIVVVNWHYDGDSTSILNVEHGTIRQIRNNHGPAAEDKIITASDVTPSTYAEYLPAFQSILNMVKFFESHHEVGPDYPMNWDHPHLTPLRKQLTSTLSSVIGARMLPELEKLSIPKTIERGYATSHHAGFAKLTLSAKEISVYKFHYDSQITYTLNLTENTIYQRISQNGQAYEKAIASPDVTPSAYREYISALEQMLETVKFLESHHEVGTPPDYPMNWEDAYLIELGLRSYIEARLEAIQ